ncbi:MAG TPA: GntG family PLP-dependent aldolase [Candidatus Eisenbacteria bacterium]|nr:GntG family PLP-dependent aldolase [Candidatus Eisenbacteria bacterium]
MRRAMAEAEVGDDVLRDDPTVRLLEEETAAVLGKEASLFVPSGCMGNEIAVATHTRRGDSILLHRDSHLVYTESAAMQGLLGLAFQLLEGDRGLLRADDVARTLDEERDGIRLLSLEQTNNWSSGSVYTRSDLHAVASAARERGLPVHLDGARIWNASAASGVAPAEFAAAADTVMVCFSKGLGAPVGSALASTAARIQEARAVRKMLGGGMRQVGIVAAGALHGLRHHRERLVDDHRRAHRLAEAIAEVPGIRLDPSRIETNILIAEIEPPHDRLPRFVEAVGAAGVGLLAFGGPGRFRAATHLDVDDAGIDRAVAAIRAAARDVLGAA